MNILLINHYAGSSKLGMEYRPYYLAKYWLKMGHNITVVAASYSHVRTTQPLITESFTEEVIDGIKYIWLKTPAYRGNGPGRIWNMLVFVTRLFLFSKKIIKLNLPEAVIASSTYPLDIFPALRISKKSNSKLVFEVHDLWPLSPMELGNYSRFHPFILLIQYAENFAYKNSDKVVSMLPLALSHMETHGLIPHKFSYIPNGIDISSWNSKLSIPDEYKILIQKLKSENRTIVGYTGSIGIANALDSFVESAKLLVNENISFLIVGNGPEKQMLVKKAAEHNLTNIFFLNPISKDFIPALLSEFDIVYIGLKRQKLFRFGISPNKLIDYMMAARPVIQSIESGNNLVKEAGCGFSARAEDPESIAAAILKLANYDKETRDEMGLKGREYILRHNTYESLSKKFIKVLED
jgi:glycosyltransferase involved in cell wall biosynthesis